MTPHDHKLIARKQGLPKRKSAIIFEEEETSIVARVESVGRFVEDIEVGQLIYFNKGSFDEIEDGLYSVSVDPSKLFIYEGELEAES